MTYSEYNFEKLTHEELVNVAKAMQSDIKVARATIDELEYNIEHPKRVIVTDELDFDLDEIEFIGVELNEDDAVGEIQDNMDLADHRMVVIHDEELLNEFFNMYGYVEDLDKGIFDKSIQIEKEEITRNDIIFLIKKEGVKVQQYCYC